MNSTRKIVFLKHFTYTMIVIFLYIFQTTPVFLSIMGVKPVLVVPAAILIAMFEGEFTGGIYGALAGLLCDINIIPRVDGRGSLLFGFNGFMICTLCIAVGLLTIYLLRCNLFSCMLFVTLSMLILESLSFLFAHGMWGYENVHKVYTHYILPGIGYTLAVTPLIFWLFRGTFKRFELALRR